MGSREWLSLGSRHRCRRRRSSEWREGWNRMEGGSARTTHRSPWSHRAMQLSLPIPCTRATAVTESAHESFRRRGQRLGYASLEYVDGEKAKAPLRRKRPRCCSGGEEKGMGYGGREERSRDCGGDGGSGEETRGRREEMERGWTMKRIRMRGKEAKVERG
uniref:Uncharacterized protein n=1 Tax=Oryza nivara TaxID=4536 RepID=A0A0E0J391_ORYNI